MPAVSPTDRSLVATIGAHASRAQTTDRSARTAPARAALDRKFLEQADGDPVRAAHLRKAYFARLALKSVQGRRKVQLLTAEAAAAFDDLTRTNRDSELVQQTKFDWANTFRTSHFIPAVDYINANRLRTTALVACPEQAIAFTYLFL